MKVRGLAAANAWLGSGREHERYTDGRWEALEEEDIVPAGVFCLRRRGESRNKMKTSICLGCRPDAPILPGSASR